MDGYRACCEIRCPLLLVLDLDICAMKRRQLPTCLLYVIRLECAACLDASVAKRITKSDRILPGKELLARIVAMLTRLVERFDPDEFRIREDGING